MSTQTSSTKFLDTPTRNAVSVTQIDIHAPVARVFDAFLNEPDKWFYESEESRDATPTRCDPRIGGHFYTQYPKNGFNSLGMITMIKPNKKIRMRGDCTMPAAVLMNMTIEFHEIDGGTRVVIEHRMSGEIEDSWPGDFEEGWHDGLVKLKMLTES